MKYFYKSWPGHWDVFWCFSHFRFRAPLSTQGCKCVPANYHPTKCLEGGEYPFPDFRDNNCDSGVIL